MNPVDLAFTPALDQASLIGAGEISPLELTQLYLERIERLNPRLGSYFLVMAEQAIADAKAKTETLGQKLAQDSVASSDKELPPFFGVPIAIKDLSPVAGVPCSYGVGILRNRMATEDAGIVTKIKQAGFIILGKTATSELGSTPYTEPRGFPPTRNPWNPDYTPGGSSGGAAAAVAAGLSPVAHGSDGGGSIRGPAACCGLVGIKPSRGRVSHAPIGDKLSGLSIDGPIARTVSDAAALLDVLAGYIPGDPYWLPDPPQSFLAATRHPVNTLRIAFTTNIPPVGQIHPVYEQALLDMVALLKDLGHQVEPIELDFTELAEPLITVWQAGVDMGVPRIFLGKLNRWLLGRSRSNSGGVYLRAVMQMQAFARRLVATLDPFDVLLLPVFKHPIIRVGEWAPLRAAKQFEQIVNWVAPCPPFNATGQPAIALPVGFDPNGLPIGIQFIGRPTAETTLIALAAQVENAKPWIHHRPALGVEG